MFKYIIISLIAFNFTLIAEESPKETKKIINNYSEDYQKIIEKAQKDVNKIKAKALKDLEKELKKAKKRNVSLAEKISDQINDLEAQQSLASMVNQNNDSDFFSDIGETKKINKEAMAAKIEFSCSDDIILYFCVEFSDIEFFRKPDFPKWVKKYGLTPRGEARFKDKQKYVDWLKRNNLVLSSDIIKDFYPDLYKDGVRLFRAAGAPIKVNGVTLRTSDSNTWADYRFNFNAPELDFWKTYKEKK